MNEQKVTVVYKWTAHPGKLDALSAIYDKVSQTMEANEPDATAVHVYRSEDDNALYVRDEFAHARALAFHLEETAGPHFPGLLEIATPGPFFFMGNVPDELKQATEQMQLGAEFSEHQIGFER